MLKIQSQSIYGGPMQQWEQYTMFCIGACKHVLAHAGVLKVVFATETLAAGINMPARTTIISTLSRRRDQGIQMLTHNELLQMAGRAGRRGFDTTGCMLTRTLPCCDTPISVLPASRDKRHKIQAHVFHFTCVTSASSYAMSVPCITSLLLWAVLQATAWCCRAALRSQKMCMASS